MRRLLHPVAAGRAGQHEHHLSEQQRADRWDRQFFADCAACGHSWGLHAWDIGGGSHDTHAGCHALLLRTCLCPGYTPAARP